MLDKQKTHLSPLEKSVVSGLLKKEKEFMCCANCGSVDITFPPTNVDALIGVGSLPRRYYCRECEYEGLPIIFDSLTAYEKFYALRREKYNKGEDILVSDGLLSGNFGSETVKKPYVAALLSLIIPGLGQAYNGEKEKATGIFTIFLMLSLLVPLVIFLVEKRTHSGIIKFGDILPLSLAGVILLEAYTLFDAYIVAKTNK